MAPTLRDPVRPINLEILNSLELEQVRVYPLPGGNGRRWSSEVDPRLSKLNLTPVGDNVTYYEHLATVRDRKSKIFYVVFRETADGQLTRESDLTKYPEWLMKTLEKQRERRIYIYWVKKHPKEIAVMRSHEDWLATIEDEATFDAVWHFLAKHNVVPAA